MVFAMVTWDKYLKELAAAQAAQNKTDLFVYEHVGRFLITVAASAVQKAICDAVVGAGVAACGSIGGFLADRREDQQAQRLAPELRVRQLRMRRWRQGLSRRARKGWAATGLLGKSLRQLIPSAYSQQLDPLLRSVS